MGCDQALARACLLLPAFLLLCDARGSSLQHGVAGAKYAAGGGQLRSPQPNCPRAKVVQCPEEGCGILLERKHLGGHREGCVHEKVECPCCPGDEVMMLRADMAAHMDASMGEHLQALLQEVAQINIQNAWKDVRITKLEKQVDGILHRRWMGRKVFTWSAASWDLEEDAESECLQFCDGVTAQCSLDPAPEGEPARRGFALSFVKLELRVGVAAKFSILDPDDDAIPRDGDPMDITWGSASSPDERFTATDPGWVLPFDDLTDEEKARALREDGSIKLRAVVDVYHLLGHPVSVVEEPASASDEIFSD